MGGSHSNYAEIPESVDDDSHPIDRPTKNNRHELTMADTIHMISRRDSDSYLNKGNSSPWVLDSDQSIPMISSPHLFSLEAMNKKHNEALKNASDQRRDEKRRADSMDQGSYSRGAFPIENEDEQWQKKRKEKLHKVISASSLGSYATSTSDIVNDLKKEFEKTSNPAHISIMYGLINTIIVLPVLMSFGSIIYSDAFFRPYLPILVKLTVLSGAVHQLCFSTFSTLPFSVGQVQDAGLIFLSTIATNIVSYCKDQGCSDEQILATTLIGLSTFTAILGVGLIIIGRLRLASVIRRLPMPVVGGYLAFIGFFCGKSGLSLMSGVHVSGIGNWNRFLKRKSLILMLPGVAGGCFIFLSVRKLKHMSVLPLSIFSLLVTFYIILYFNGMSLDEAKELGWISQADPPPIWSVLLQSFKMFMFLLCLTYKSGFRYHSWDYIRFDKVVWSALPSQFPIVISMIFVVALSSSLDIAAIDLELPKPLEYNYELRMIGISNICSGITGGYTGSYIFSQTLFTLRSGVRSRLSGYTIAICELILVMLPISILSYIPNFIFGSLLVMICVDLVVEWLWDVRKKISSIEYVVALSTFLMIQVLGIEYGILGGLFLSMLLTRLMSSSYRDE